MRILSMQREAIFHVVDMKRFWHIRSEQFEGVRRHPSLAVAMDAARGAAKKCGILDDAHTLIRVWPRHSPSYDEVVVDRRPVGRF